MSRRYHHCWHYHYSICNWICFSSRIRPSSQRKTPRHICLMARPCLLNSTLFSSSNIAPSLIFSGGFFFTSRLLILPVASMFVMAGKLMLAGIVVLASSSHLAHGALDHDLMRIYTANNLTYSCLPYITKATIAACDCMACNRDTPDFKDRMCKFFEEARKKGKGDLLNPNLVNVCTSKAICPNIPNQCCNPSDSTPKYGKGCPLCLPAVKSQPSTKGHNPACLLAEYESAQTAPPKGANWRDTYEAFDSAMREAGLNQRCSSYALYKSAKLCDCEDCLQNEQNLREKWCKIGEKIRANAQLGRRAYMTNTEYFKKFCDKKTCPTIPNKCCSAPTARDEQNPVDRRGCPTCIPTSATFGFGPRCRKEITDLPQPIKLGIFGLH